MLKVLSKLGSLSVVKGSPSTQLLVLPHLCFMPSNPMLDFRPVEQAMREFISEGEWFIGSDFPRLCVLAQPKDTKYASSAAAAMVFRGHITNDIPRLSAWIEERLNLKAAPSLGLELQPIDLALEGVVDYYSPHFNNTYIVADPEKFARDNMRPTSRYDRILHFGLSLDDMEALERSALSAEPQHTQWDLISRFWQRYADQKILPREVANLRSECERLRGVSDDPLLQHACDVVLSISTSAARYNLGIFVESSE